MRRPTRRLTPRLLLAACLLVARAGLAAEPSDQKGEVATSAASACSCKACTPDACCKAPTGFAPLDEKCKGKCEQKTWTANAPDGCGKPSGCCP
jgi:hypothetical protein